MGYDFCVRSTMSTLRRDRYSTFANSLIAETLRFYPLKAPIESVGAQHAVPADIPPRMNRHAQAVLIDTRPQTLSLAHKFRNLRKRRRLVPKRKRPFLRDLARPSQKRSKRRARQRRPNANPPHPRRRKLRDS